jgi:hypothetical protein
MIEASLDPRERMRTCLRQRVPPCILRGGAVASARYRESAVLISRYLAAQPGKRGLGFTFVDAMNAVFFMEACAEDRIGADGLAA